jgi:hypothetical protein
MNSFIIIRRIIFSAIVALGIFTTSASLTRPVQAHPGNTAADGAHYCWTNCEYWGETYGERHSHSGGGGGGVYEEEEYIPDEPEVEYPDDEGAYYGTNPSASAAPEPDYYDTTSEYSQSSSESDDEDDSSFWWIIGGLGFFAWIGYAIYKE